MLAAQTSIRRLADRTRREIEGLWALTDAGEMPLREFRARATAVVAQANQAGASIGDLGLAAEITRQLGRVTAPLGLTASDVALDQDRMAADIDRLINRDEDPSSALGDWAASEPYLTSASAVQAGMVARGVSGWTRQLSGASCPLCVGWADGIVRPATTSMVRHPGCDCIQQPVL